MTPSAMPGNIGEPGVRETVISQRAPKLSLRRNCNRSVHFCKYTSGHSTSDVTSQDVNETSELGYNEQDAIGDEMLIAELIGKDKNEGFKDCKDSKNHDSLKYSRIKFQNYAN